MMQCALGGQLTQGVEAYAINAVKSEGGQCASEHHGIDRTSWCVHGLMCTCVLCNVRT